MSAISCLSAHCRKALKSSRISYILPNLTRRLSWHASFKSEISYLSAARRSASRLCENMLQKTGDLAARTERWAPMLPSEALIMISVWMPSVNIRPRHARAVAFDCFFVNPSAQMELGSPPCKLTAKSNC